MFHFVPSSRLYSHFRQQSVLLWAASCFFVWKSSSPVRPTSDKLGGPREQPGTGTHVDSLPLAQAGCFCLHYWYSSPLQKWQSPSKFTASRPQKGRVFTKYPSSVNTSSLPASFLNSSKPCFSWAPGRFLCLLLIQEHSVAPHCLPASHATQPSSPCPHGLYPLGHPLLA